MNISNQANATYNAVPPNQPGVPGSLTSNTVSTEVLSDVIKRVMTRQTFCQRRRNRSYYGNDYQQFIGGFNSGLCYKPGARRSKFR